MILFISLCMCAGKVTRAQETLIRPFLGVTAGYNLIAGSYDGESFFQTDEDIMLVPAISPAFGVGGVMGLAYEKFTIDFGYHYARSAYTTMEDGYSGDCTTHLVRFLGAKRYFNAYADRTVSPYLDFDLTLAYNNLDKIAYPLGSMGDPVRGRYGGIMIGLGAGVRIRLADKLAADLRILPEYYLGTDIRVKGRDWYQISKFGNFLLHNTLGLKYYFRAF